MGRDLRMPSATCSGNNREEMGKAAGGREGIGQMASGGGRKREGVEGAGGLKGVGRSGKEGKPRGKVGGGGG